MEIRVIELRKAEGTGKVRGFATVEIAFEGCGAITIRDFKILNGGNGPFVVSPQISWWDGKSQTKMYREICVLPKELKAKVSGAILAQYEQEEII